MTDRPHPKDTPRGANDRERLMAAIGLCARARKLVAGTPLVCEALRKGGRTPILAVIEAGDTSANTHDKLTSKCAFYRTPHYRIEATTAELGRAIGKAGVVAAVGVTDPHLFELVGSCLPPAQNDQPDSAP